MLPAEEELIAVTISEQVVAGTQRAVARSVLQTVFYFGGVLRSTGLRIMPNPLPEDYDHRLLKQRGLPPGFACCILVV